MNYSQLKRHYNSDRSRFYLITDLGYECYLRDIDRYQYIRIVPTEAQAKAWLMSRDKVKLW